MMTLSYYLIDRGVQMGISRVFIVEENMEVAVKLYDHIQKLNGFEVIEMVSDGESCMTSPKLKHTDILLVNDLLPVIDGLTILQKLNERSLLLPNIIFLCSIPSPYVRMQAEKAGASLIVQKPYEIDDLIEQMRSLTYKNRRKQYQPDELNRLITKCVLSIGLLNHLSGCRYLIETIAIILDDRHMSRFITTEVFPIIAAKNNISVNSVARRIHYAIELSWIQSEAEMRKYQKQHHLAKHFAYKPSVTEVITLIINKILPDLEEA
jgi:two-component system, response regulator, stage 0 sporulation protein A